MDESSRRIDGRPRELRHNMRAIYCKNRNGATLQNVICRTACALVHTFETRLLGPG